MATSLGTVSWGSSPTISIALSYDYSRSGANMIYNVHVSVQPVTGASYFGYPIYVEVKMDGSAHGSGTIKNASPSQWGSAISWSTGSQTISNKTSGTTSLSVRIYSGSGSSRNTTYSYSMAVSPAGSTISTPNGTLGTQQTITITKQNAAFTDTITYTCGSASGTIVTDTLAGSVNWTPPVSLSSQNTTGTSVSITLKTTTKSSGTTIQSNSTTITCAIPASVKPSCTVAISDPTGYATAYGAYVQSKSTLKAVITATTSYGSPINTYKLTADGNTYTTQTTTTPVLQNTGAQNVVATVTDKRGRTSDPATAAYSVLAYAQPTLSSYTIQRSDAGGTADPEGHYMAIDFTGAITALNNVNSAVWAIRYRVTGAGVWTDVAIPSLTGNYTPTHQEVIAAADANTFEVEIRATDDFGTITVGTGQIPVAFTIMNWRTQGDGMAIGGINTKAGLQVYMPQENYGKNNTNTYGTYSFATSYQGGTNGFLRIATITITGVYLSTPIEFEVFRRHDSKPVSLWLSFESANTTDPAIRSLWFDSATGTQNIGYVFEAFATKTATSTWDVYVRKSEAYDNICVITNCPRHAQGVCNITYSDNLLTSAPSGATMATSAEMLGVPVSVTLSSANITFSNVYCFQFGKLVVLGFDATVKVAMGTGGATQYFSVSGFPTPVSTYIRTRTMTGTATLDIYIGKSGSSSDCGIRNNGNTAISANTLLSSCYFVYVCE